VNSLSRYLALAGCVTLLDQATKCWVWTHLVLGQKNPVVGAWLSWTYCHNTGGAFSLLAGARSFFLCTALLVSCVLLYSLYHSADKYRLPSLAYSLILGGAVGNLIDRSLYGYVVDFIDLGWWPVFNVADSGICMGVAFLFFSLLTGRDET
jgi:signal peptidase II